MGNLSSRLGVVVCVLAAGALVACQKKQDNKGAQVTVQPQQAVPPAQSPVMGDDGDQEVSIARDPGPGVEDPQAALFTGYWSTDDKKLALVPAGSGVLQHVFELVAAYDETKKTVAGYYVSALPLNLVGALPFEGETTKSVRDYDQYGRLYFKLALDTAKKTATYHLTEPTTLKKYSVQLSWEKEHFQIKALLTNVSTGAKATVIYKKIADRAEGLRAYNKSAAYRVQGFMKAALDSVSASSCVLRAKPGAPFDSNRFLNYAIAGDSACVGEFLRQGFVPTQNQLHAVMNYSVERIYPHVLKLIAPLLPQTLARIYIDDRTPEMKAVEFAVSPGRVIPITPAYVFILSGLAPRITELNIGLEGWWPVLGVTAIMPSLLIDQLGKVNNVATRAQLLAHDALPRFITAIQRTFSPDTQLSIWKKLFEIGLEVTTRYNEIDDFYVGRLHQWLLWGASPAVVDHFISLREDFCHRYNFVIGEPVGGYLFQSTGQTPQEYIERIRKEIDKALSDPKVYGTLSRKRDLEAHYKELTVKLDSVKKLKCEPLPLPQ